ncbi:inward rectifier potassium channel irk-1-like [Octopus sinensis]|uniref:Inward rectifier potassium channel irk-1-like n=1 Tax=Octopus sinensis TaxID=2607531 RepID=A0A7E6EI75_9MOLL|nr:inward rectifier potassium channel irk-1-like [Octopus sinensis]
MTVTEAILNYKNEFNVDPTQDWARSDIRLVEKNGEFKFNISASRKKRFFKDFVTTLLMLNWLEFFIFFLFLYVISCTIFAVIWYILVLNQDHVNKKDCVYNLNTFLGAMIFSMVTQSTVGYGDMYISSDCYVSGIVLTLQTLIGIYLEAITLGLAFKKISTPLSRAKTWIFSKKAVICQRNGEKYLICRILNIQKSQLIASNVKMFFVCSRMTVEGEIIPFYFKRLAINFDSSLSDSGWPITVTHLINENSPLCKYDQNSFIFEGCEIIVIVTGISESSGHSVKSRTSYKSNEVLWNHKFANIFSLSGNDWEINIEHFHKTIAQEKTRHEFNQ